MTPMNPRSPATLATLALAAALLAGRATAADMAPSLAAAPRPAAAPAALDPLAGARALIAVQKWSAAIAELQRVADPASADWNNLMGYSHRKAKVPDLAAAERYYDAALRIAPQHRGALEYSGELYLQRGDLTRAMERLAQLDALCGVSCAERIALHRAMVAFLDNPQP
jgi:tetratricopeptide (TPR) repeat protein